MKRKIYDELVKWKNESKGRTALLIEGARRVGKTYIAEEFAKNNYKSYIIVDFSKVPNTVKELFNNYIDNLDYLFTYLTQYYGVELYERESLFIFDEIQFCPKAREAIKHLVFDHRYDYIETGSLISIKKNVKDILIPSEEEKINLYSMDYEEFLWAMGNDLLMDYIKNCFQKKIPLGSDLHRKAMDYFKEYLIVGGMPQAVEEYSQTRNFQNVDKIKRTIINMYRDDIRKHSEKLNLKVEQIFDTIPSQLSKHEKKFNLSILDEEARYRSFEGAFYWLMNACLINIAYNTTEPNIGLGQRLDSNTLKCYMMDTGLLLSMTFNEKNIIDEQIYKKIFFDSLEFNSGMILENMVAQMLTCNNNKLYFFSRQDRENSINTMEIDFLISKNSITSCHNIIPIEVKSSKRYTYTSLNKFMKKYNNYLDKPIIIHTKDLENSENILYIPIYMTGIL